MLRVTGIHHAFGGRPVLSGVDFVVPEGAMVGLIGPSGGGKSVLLKILAGVLEPEAGSVDRRGREGQPDAPDEPEVESESGPAAVSLMFQEGALFDSLSVFDNIAFPLVNGTVPTTILSRPEQSEVSRRVSEILAAVGLTNAAFKMPGQLSGGMRRRVSLARALVSHPRLVLLDDPTSGLDPVASSVIMDLIRRLHDQFRFTTVMVSQDLRRLLPVVDSVMALFGGQIVFNGTVPELVAGAPEEVRTFVACRFDLQSMSRSTSESPAV